MKLILFGLFVISIIASPTFADDWPQWRGVHRDGVWHETGIIEKFDEPEVSIRWRLQWSHGRGWPRIRDGSRRRSHAD